jgi:hypothetical protein
MKYRDNMSEAEITALLAECAEHDRAYAEAEAIVRAENDYWDRADADDDWMTDDTLSDSAEMAILRKAALNHRGQP